MEDYSLDRLARCDWIDPLLLVSLRHECEYRAMTRKGEERIFFQALAIILRKLEETNMYSEKEIDNPYAVIGEINLGGIGG